MFLASWNIGTLLDKSVKLVKLLHRRKISIVCILETKWVSTKAKEIDGYKPWYSEFNKVKNGIVILIEKELVQQVVEVKYKSDRIISVKFMVDLKIFNIVRAYVSQIGLEEDTKRLF